jgi:holo-[acyl-carrier protein] synthase
VIVGIGVDLVGVERLGRALGRSPGLRGRLFAERETTKPTMPERGLGLESLAGRFAAKEARMKALGSPGNLRWVDAVVVSASSGRPGLEVFGSVRARCDALGVRALHLSISHDAGLAMAMVVAEG